MRSIVRVIQLCCPAAVVLVLFAAQSVSAATMLPQYRYTKSFDTAAGHGSTKGMAVDGNGDVYVVGSFGDTVDFAGSSGTDTASAPSTDSPYLAKYRNDGTYLWVRSFDVSAGDATGQSVAVDKLGNAYITGTFSDTVIFDGVGGSHSQTLAPGIQGAFVTKYNTDGAYQWTKTFDVSAGSAFGGALAADSHNNVYLTGTFFDTVDFGGSDTFTAGPNGNIFTTKFAADGSYAWTKVFDSTSATIMLAMSIAVDASDNVYAGGVFSGTVVFDGVGGSQSETDATGDGNTYITKYNTNGAYQWTNSFDTAPGGYSYGSQGLSIDPSGNIYTVGAISGTVTLGPGDTKSAIIKGAVTLVKYNPDGSYAWSKVLSDAGGWSDGWAVATDVLGDVYTTGEFYNTVTFDGTNDPHTAAVIGSDTFLTKYNPDGSYAWTRTAELNSGGQAAGFAIAADTLGNVFAAGFFNGTVTFDGPGGSDSHTAAGGSYGGFLTSYIAFVPPAVPTPTTVVAKSKASITPVATSEAVASEEPVSAEPLITESTPIENTDTDTPIPVKKQSKPIFVLTVGILVLILLLLIWRQRRPSKEK